MNNNSTTIEFNTKLNQIMLSSGVVSLFKERYFLGLKWGVRFEYNGNLYEIKTNKAIIKNGKKIGKINHFIYPVFTGEIEGEVDIEINGLQFACSNTSHDFWEAKLNNGRVGQLKITDLGNDFECVVITESSQSNVEIFLILLSWLWFQVNDVATI